MDLNVRCRRWPAQRPDTGFVCDGFRLGRWDIWGCKSHRELTRNRSGSPYNYLGRHISCINQLYSFSGYSFDIIFFRASILVKAIPILNFPVNNSCTKSASSLWSFSRSTIKEAELFCWSCDPYEQHRIHPKDIFGFAQEHLGWQGLPKLHGQYFLSFINPRSGVGHQARIWI